MSEVTAEIIEGMSISRGPLWVLQLWTDREPAARGGLTKGKKAGSLVGDSVPHLLRTTADYMDQEGYETLADLAGGFASKLGGKA